MAFPALLTCTEKVLGEATPWSLLGRRKSRPSRGTSAPSSPPPSFRLRTPPSPAGTHGHPESHSHAHRSRLVTPSHHHHTGIGARRLRRNTGTFQSHPSHTESRPLISWVLGNQDALRPPLCPHPPIRLVGHRPVVRPGQAPGAGRRHAACPWIMGPRK